MDVFRLRQRHPDYFKRTDLFYCVCQYLGSYHFRAPVRKYILEIFDMRFTTELLEELDNVAQRPATTSHSDQGDDVQSEAPPSPDDDDRPERKLEPDNKKAVPQETLEPKCKKVGFDVAS